MTYDIPCVNLGSDEKASLLSKEPVITSGEDVSRYLVDTRDDHDPALTFRSLFLGTIFAGLGAALCQVRDSHRNYWHILKRCCRQIYLFKPVQVTVSTVFLLLLIYSVGMAWAKFLPRGSLVEGTRLAPLKPILDFVNPGEFRIKEVRLHEYHTSSEICQC